MTDIKMNSFSHLNEEEIQNLAKTPMYIGVLLAEADGFVDEKELEWIRKIASFRSKNAHHSLRNFYALSHTIISENINLFRSDLPTDLNEKMTFLSNKIAEANPILAKLDQDFKERVVLSFKAMALSVAEIDGGLLNFFSHNPSEEKWLQLPMIKI